MSSSASVSMTCRPFSPASEISDWTVSAPTPRYRLMQRSISASGARAIWKSRPVARRSSSIAEVSKGSLVTASRFAVVPFHRHDVLVQKDAGGESGEKLPRERAGFELDKRQSQLASQEPQQRLVGHAADRKGPGRRLALGEQAADSPGRGFVNQTLIEHSVYKCVHGIDRALVQHSTENQQGFLPHSENLPEILLGGGQFLLWPSRGPPARR